MVRSPRPRPGGTRDQGRRTCSQRPRRRTPRPGRAPGSSAAGTSTSPHRVGHLSFPARLTPPRGPARPVAPGAGRRGDPAAPGSVRASRDVPSPGPAQPCPRAAAVPPCAPAVRKDSHAPPRPAPGRRDRRRRRSSRRVAPRRPRPRRAAEPAPARPDRGRRRERRVHPDHPGGLDPAARFRRRHRSGGPDRRGGTGRLRGRVDERPRHRPRPGDHVRRAVPRLFADRLARPRLGRPGRLGGGDRGGPGRRAPGGGRSSRAPTRSPARLATASGSYGTCGTRGRTTR